MDAQVRQAEPVSSAGHEQHDREVVYFVHIPKTAGTSFRLALERDPAFNMLYDYGAASTESTPALLAQVAGGANGLGAIAASGKINVICGHIHFRKYAGCVAAHNVLSLVRNPLERLVSEYQHLVRNENYEKRFPEFISSPFEINKQWNMLDGVDLRAGGLFGLASHYGAYMELVRRRFDVPLEAIVCNQAPEADKGKRYDISAEDVALAFALNDREMEIILDVAEVFAEALRASGYNTIPPDETCFNCNIEGNRRFVGWVSRGPQDCYFVQLSVNGQPRAIVNLDRRRPDVVGQGLSEDERCGFSYPLALLGVRDNDRVGMTVVGAEGLRKSVVFHAGGGLTDEH